MVSDEATAIAPLEGMPNKWTHGGLPVLLVLVMTLWRIFVDGGGPDILAEQGAAAASVTAAVLGGALTPGLGIGVGTGSAARAMATGARALSGSTAVRSALTQASSGAAQGFLHGRAFGEGISRFVASPPSGIARAAGYWVGFGSGFLNSKLGGLL